MSKTSAKISKEDFIDILQDQDITRADDLLIFQTLYLFENHEGSATDIADELEWKGDGAVVLKIFALAKRILKNYDFQPRRREDGSLSYWDLFFDGYEKGTFFIYQLKPNLKDALEELNLVNTTKNKETENTYLFIWNPKRWHWTNLEENIEEVNSTGRCKERWSCGNTKSIHINDRIFLMRVGEEPRGIMASGYVTSDPYFEKHWGDSNKEALFVDIEFEILLNPDKEPILTLDILKQGNLEKQNWTPQASGISIKKELINDLEALWFEFITTEKIRFNPFESNNIYTQSSLKEGNAIQVLMTRYERNPFARKRCIEHFGYTCVVCDFNFEKIYGKIGNNFIHVHHLVHLSSKGITHEVDPISDLRPVCPNCHAMLHKQNPPLTINELKIRLKSSN